MTIIICEAEFRKPDPDRPEVSLTEIDYYAWIPYQKRSKDLPNHSLSLRKNMETGEFEVYRDFVRGGEKVVFSGSLEGAVHFANREYERMFGDPMNDKVCQHEPPQMRADCKIWQEKPEEEKRRIHKEIAEGKREPIMRE